MLRLILRCSIIFALTVLFLLMSAGCYKTTSSSQSCSQADTISVPQDSSDSSDQSQMNDRIKLLLDNNRECLDIFSFSILPIDNTVIEDKYQKVVSDRFRAFDDLKAFVTDTYAQRAVDYLLDDFVGEGHPLYFGKDGNFYIEDEYGGNSIQLYDWSQYTFQYTDIDSKTKLVSISLMQRIDTPDGIDFIPVTIKEKIVLEDGVWKLNDYLLYAQPDGTFCFP